MANSFLLEIVTPDKKFFEGQVELLKLRTTEGDIAVLFDHEPIVTPVSIGILKINQGNDCKYAACSDGFLSVNEEKVTLITDAAEWSFEIDVERANAALKRAQEILSNAQHDNDILITKAAVMRATNRLKASNL